MLIPLSIVVIILAQWAHRLKNTLIAIARMVVQLILVGYLLTFIFESEQWWIVLITLSIMATAAGIISLRMVKAHRKKLLIPALIAIVTSGLLNLVIVTQGVLNAHPWYNPQVVIPLAGMIFANAMNSISLASERFFAEKERGSEYIKSRSIAYKAALIPNINSFFAVGLVSLPGIMTGQILSGVDPLIAVRYQLMVMSMVLGSAGISAAIFLHLIRKTQF